MKARLWDLTIVIQGLSYHEQEGWFTEVNLMKGIHDYGQMP